MSTLGGPVRWKLTKIKVCKHPTGSLEPLARHVCAVAKGGWRLAWLTLMRELAPQSKDGDFVRPAYAFDGSIGDPSFPVRLLLCGYTTMCDIVGSPMPCMGR